MKKKQIPDYFFEIEKVKQLENHSDKILVFFLKLYLTANSKINKKNYIEVKFGISPVVWCSSIYNTSVEDVEKFLKYLEKNEYIEIDDIGICVNRLCFDNVRDRNCLEYRQWRTEVFERDNFTCQECGKRNTQLNAHHIKSFKNYPSLRFEVDNGITLCIDCHKRKHKERGKNGRG